MNMKLITIDGHIGAGALDVGKRLARMFRMRCVDRLSLPASTSHDLSAAHYREAVESQWDKAPVSDRVWSWIERASSYFAMGASGDEPMLQVAAGLNQPLTWDYEGPRAQSDSNASLSLTEIADYGNAVIVHRAGAVALADREDVTRVGIFASWDARVIRVMRREGIMDETRAESIIFARERAQKEYFERMHRADPEDAAIYDLVVNTSDQSINMTALEISRRLKQLENSALA